MIPPFSLKRVCLALLLIALLLDPAADWLMDTPIALAIAPPTVAPAEPRRFGVRPNPGPPPGPTITPYIRPDLARRLEDLRPTILAAARRHNRPELSGMSDQEFAAAITLVIYNENFGWLEEDIAPLRVFTPLYQDLQRRANQSPLGGNFSVWPTNLRPSVALEILQQQLPLPDSQIITVPIAVAGSRIDLVAERSQEELYAAVTAEISRDDLAVEYLAANLERGVYRAVYEDVPVSWRALAAWHNQGIVDPRAIRINPTARDYVRRASAYLPLARDFVAPRPPRQQQMIPI